MVAGWEMAWDRVRAYATPVHQDQAEPEAFAQTGPAADTLIWCIQVLKLDLERI